MKEIEITATRRDSTGKGVARQERIAGNIPAVVYGPEIESFPVSVDERAFRAAMRSSGRAGAIVNLNVDGNENKVILREIQRDPVTCKIIHIDFHAVSMTKPISISIPISFIGTPRGVKTDGGIMQITMREMGISCLPTDIPDKIELDVSDLGIGDSFHVRDVDIPKVQILDPERRTIVVIAAPTVIKVEETAEEEEEAVAEGEAVAEEGAETAEKTEGDAPAKGEDKKPKE